MKKIILLITVLLFITTNYLFSTSLEASKLAKKLENKTFNINYFFIKDKDNTFFLLYLFPDKKKFIVWNYTNEKKWQPVHNAKAYDGFKEANNTISSYTKDMDTITFGDAIDKNSTSKFVKQLVNKSFKINYYFWFASKTDNTVFLLYAKSPTDIMIWHLTNEKKWMPIHNTGAYDGYDGAGQTLFDLNFNKATSTLSTKNSSPNSQICIDTGFCK